MFLLEVIMTTGNILLYLPGVDASDWYRSRFNYLYIVRDFFSNIDVPKCQTRKMNLEIRQRISVAFSFLSVQRNGFGLKNQTPPSEPNLTPTNMPLSSQGI